MSWWDNKQIPISEAQPPYGATLETPKMVLVCRYVHPGYWETLVLQLHAARKRQKRIKATALYIGDQDGTRKINKPMLFDAHTLCRHALDDNAVWEVVKP